MTPIPHSTTSASPGAEEWPTPEDMDDAVHTLAEGLAREDVAGRLWIVQPNRIRVYQPPDDDS